MRTRSDFDPNQAVAQMSEVQRLLTVKESAVDDAREHFEAVEHLLNAATDPAEVARLAQQHQDAERAVEFAEQEYEEAVGELGRVQDFWYEEHIEDYDRDF